MGTKGTFSYFFEDTEGDNPTAIPGEIKFDGSYNFIPGEKEVRYYKDGSGHPGCPPEFELYDFVCTHINNEKIVDWENRIALWLEEKFTSDELRDGLITHICESLQDEKESYEENKLDYLREQSRIPY